jgi:RNA polymerase sigma-70 factor (ECF subfamily)
MSTTTSIEAVWTDFGDTLKRFILARVGDEQAAEDILQDVFLKIHAHIGGLQDEDRLQAWIFRIACNAITDYYRKPQHAAELPDDLPAPIDDGNEAERQLARSLRLMIELLPAEYRDALLLDAFEGLSQKEIAARLGLSLSGAKSRIQRGRAMLRDLLLACCHFEFDQHGRVIDYSPHVKCCAGCGDACGSPAEILETPASFLPEPRLLK